MSNSLKDRLDVLRAKTEMLRTSNARMLEAARRQRQSLDEVRTELRQANEQIKAMSVANEHLRVVHAITPSRADVERSRALLAELMRDIDKCIADIGD